MEIELTDLCQDLRNWFDRARYIGKITLDAEGGVFCNGVAVGLLEGQYFRVIGSIFADGVHKYPDTETLAESFDGAVWAMAVPPPVIKLVEDITAWRGKYEAADAAAMSPFSSESFGGYSYSKSGGGSSDSANAGGANWKSAFAARLNQWRKI
jgi:hypothetical protein